MQVIINQQHTLLYWDFLSKCAFAFAFGLHITLYPLQGSLCVFSFVATLNTLTFSKELYKVGEEKKNNNNNKSSNWFYCVVLVWRLLFFFFFINFRFCLFPCVLIVFLKMFYVSPLRTIWFLFLICFILFFKIIVKANNPANNIHTYEDIQLLTEIFCVHIFR